MQPGVAAPPGPALRAEIWLDGAASVDISRQAAAAEDLGAGTVWVGETRHDSLLALGSAVPATRSIRLATGVAIALARNPMSVAIAANDLQTWSGGRLVLGLGPQVRAHITRRFAMPWSRPAARMGEYVAALHAIWDSWSGGTGLDFAGEFYRYSLMTPAFDAGPNPFGRPPVVLAGVGEAMTEAAGAAADGFLAHPFSTARYLRQVSLPALARGRARSTRPEFSVTGSPLIATGATEEAFEAARARTRATLAFYGSTPAYRGVLDAEGWSDLHSELHALSRAGQWARMPELIDDTVLGTLAVVAEPGEVAGEVKKRFGEVLQAVALHVDVDETGLWAPILGDLSRP